MYSETRNATLNVLEKVVYEYALEGDAAGNVTQVMRKIPQDPADPIIWDVFGTHFTYNKAGEVRIVTQRHWLNFGPDPSAESGPESGSATILRIREFRGTGRERHMMRDRDTAFPHLPDYAGASWTDYEGDLPVDDYTVTDCHTGILTAAAVADDTHYALGAAEIDYCTEGESCTDDAVSYTHTNHLGTTRARTNDASHGGAPGAPVPYERPVYTAFGERIDGDVTTRYGYVGQHGYETMDALDWGEWDLDGDGTTEPVAFNFIHTGARWYDPSTGRFLQRDPIGIRTAPNVYEYGRSSPLTGVDASGLAYFPPEPTGPILPIFVGGELGGNVVYIPEDVSDPFGPAYDFIDGVINGPAGGGAGAGVTAAGAANYKWRLGIGKLVNRSGVVCAGAWVGWNGGKLIPAWKLVDWWYGVGTPKFAERY